MNVLIVVACITGLCMVVNGQGTSGNNAGSGGGNNMLQGMMPGMYGRMRGSSMSGGAGGGLASLFGGGGNNGGFGGLAMVLGGLNIQDMARIRMCLNMPIQWLSMTCVNNVIN